MFLKKFASLVLVLLWAAAPAFAQAPPALPQEALDAFAKEAPLTQADIDSFIKVITANANPQDQAAIAAAVKETGWSQIRLGYVTSKVNVANLLAMGAPPETLNQFPEVLRPTEAELALVKANSQKLQEVIMKAGAAAQM